MTSSLIMHYPSKLTSYYATGGWQNLPKIRNQQFDLNHNSSIFFTGNKSDKCALPLFQANLIADNTQIPSKVKNAFWIQAPISKVGEIRLPYITCNSGKFLISVPFGEIFDHAWEEFKKVYSSAKLGYALQCSTLSNLLDIKGTCSGLITVHMEDSFDLSAISKVAYEIFKTLHGIWPNYQEGSIEYITDRTTKAKTKYSGPCCINALTGIHAN